MAAGSWNSWTQGDIVTNAKFQDIQDSIVFIYASDSAANTALTNKVEGTVYFNTTDDVLKFWDGSAWVALEGVKAFTVDFLVIAGGGGGGSTYALNYTSGGGAAGGYLNSYSTETSGGGNSSLESLTILADGTTTYAINIGAGGTGGVGNVSAATIGSPSYFHNAVAFGGGAGFATGQGANNIGHGASSSGQVNNNNVDQYVLGSAIGASSGYQGYRGGYQTSGSTGYGAGGGGAASAVGGNASNNGGNGGAGLASSITGSSTTRAGGGGGGSLFNTQGTGGSGGGGAASSTNGVAGTANTGSGGGANASQSQNGYSGGNGGSGVVILRYSSDYTISVGAGLTDGGEQTDGADKYIVFTAGSGTVTFS